MNKADLLQMMIDLVNDIYGSGVKFTFLIFCIAGIVGTATILIKANQRLKHGASQSSHGNTLLGIIFCVCLVGLYQLMSAASNTAGLGDVSLEAIAYVQTDHFGQSAAAINAFLTLLRLVGFIIFGLGVLSLKRSTLDGHSSLSAANDRSNGIVRMIVGVLLFNAPHLLDAVQNTIHIHW